jgi:hypothetical protein
MLDQMGGGAESCRARPIPSRHNSCKAPIFGVYASENVRGLLAIGARLPAFDCGSTMQAGQFGRSSTEVKIAPCERGGLLRREKKISREL